MNSKIKKLRLLSTSIILSMTLVIPGCSTKKAQEKENVETTTSVVSEIQSSKTNENKTKYVEETITQQSSKKNIENSKLNEESQDKYTMEDVIDYFKDLDEKLMDKALVAKDKILEDYYIIYDFIFNDTTIKGYTFDELKDNLKEKVMDIYLNIDEKIDKHYPDYKEKIKEKYGNIKDKVKDKLTDFKDSIIDHIGEDKYESIVDTKDKYVDGFREQTKDDISDVKELVKNIWGKIRN